jgi:hypothetical protein
MLQRLLSMPPQEAGNEIARISSHRFQAIMSQMLTLQRQTRRERQLNFYAPVSTKAERIHTTDAKTIGVGGGNGSSKTETCIVEAAMCSTGIFPLSLRDRIDVDAKFRGPLNVRVVCESLTTVLHPIILPKLQWWKWTGVDAPGGDRGHWGWIPRDCLIAGSWERSWSEKLRQLRVLCRDPNNPGKVVGESTWQFMSRDQDPTDFASGDFHIIIHDEPPTLAIWRENQARTMRVAGRMFLAMTWPDDPSIAVDWIYDEVYEPAARGDDGKLWINLWTTENPHLDQVAVEQQRHDWSKAISDVRIFGQPIRFSNRIHPLFTDEDDCWCFTCGKTCTPSDERIPRCMSCGSGVIAPFNHVREFEVNPHWPAVFLIDPHPRKPHMYQWWQVDPNDDLWHVAEGEMNGDPTLVRDDVYETEREFKLHVQQRIIDPNMGRSPSSATRREETWQDSFSEVGLRTDLADDSDVGRSKVNEYLRPDKDTLCPRIHVHPRCARYIHQMKRYVWAEYRTSLERDVKQKPKEKNDDDPTLTKYLLSISLTRTRRSRCSRGACRYFGADTG